MKNKANKVLFFTKGAVPTKEELAAASAINGAVMFRNSAFVASDLSVEKCDAVAGNVPPVYADKFPSAGTEVEPEAVEEVKEPAEPVKDSLPVVPEAPIAPAAPTVPVGTVEDQTPAAPTPTAPVPPAPAAQGDGWPQS